MGALGFAIEVRTGLARFDPSRLFTGGGDGAWFDIGDPATLFQDVAGTVAAALGSPVARIADKSGRGHHATQATASARPVLREEAGRRFLQFDGVDDHLVHDLSAAGDATLSAAAQRTGGEAVQGLFSATPPLTPLRALVWARAVGEHWGMYADADWRSAGFDASARCVMTAIGRTAAATIRLHTDGGAPVDPGGAYAGDDTDRRAIGRELSTVAMRHFCGRFYGAVAVARALDSAELAALVGWQRSAAGIG